MENHFIAWWNLENLFNAENSPERPDWLKSYLKSELKGWTAEILDKKISQLSSIIKLLNEGAGPDILGVCEIEDAAVLNKLITGLADLNRNYGIAHYDSPDKRGIDVAFIYDKDKFQVAEQFTLRILKRSPTRDIFQVNFKTVSGKDLVLIGNHWPARLGGVLESEPYRIIAAETLSYWMSRIWEIMGKNVCVLAMGDFNDEPISRSLINYALSTNNRLKVVKSNTSPRMFNLMWSDMAEGIGSYYYSNFPLMFDQFLASKGLVLTTSPLRVKIGSAKVEKFDVMTKGSYKTARNFGRPSRKSSFDMDGYSDHFPISVILEEK